MSSSHVVVLSKTYMYFTSNIIKTDPTRTFHWGGQLRISRILRGGENIKIFAQNYVSKSI